MINDDFEIVLASVPDKEHLVAEIWYKNEYFCELSQENPESATLEIYPRRSGGPWSFGYTQAMSVIEKARERLVGR
jgi:hypothetical protein